MQTAHASAGSRLLEVTLYLYIYIYILIDRYKEINRHIVLSQSHLNLQGPYPGCQVKTMGSTMLENAANARFVNLYLQAIASQ